jgi:uncharacterized membrane protein
MNAPMKKANIQSLSTHEARLFATGVVFSIFWISTLLVLSLTQHTYSGPLLSMVATHLVSGRAGGISIGLELDLPTWIVVLNATIIDSLIVLLIFPLFVLSSKSMLSKPFFKDVLKTSIDSARKGQRKISRFGIAGLLLFVWLPLHATGPLAGAIIGYFMGLRPFLNIMIVLTGTFLAIISWVIFMRQILEVTGRFSFLIPLFVIVVAVTAFFYIRYRNRKEAS